MENDEVILLVEKARADRFVNYTIDNRGPFRRVRPGGLQRDKLRNFADYLARTG